MAEHHSHPDAPFPTIEAALDVGGEFMRQFAARDGGSPMGAFAERQPNGEGYYVRAAWVVTLPARTPRGRKRRDTRTAEIGLIRCDAETAARVALVHELHEQSTGGIIDEQIPGRPGVFTIRNLQEIDLEGLARAVVKAIRKGTGAL